MADNSSNSSSTKLFDKTGKFSTSPDSQLRAELLNKYKKHIIIGASVFGGIVLLVGIILIILFGTSWSIYLFCLLHARFFSR